MGLLAMSDLSPAGRATKGLLWCLNFIAERHPRLRGHRLVYRLFSSPHAEGLDKFEFLNYGYVPLDAAAERLELGGEEEIYRSNIQLYHYVASAEPLQGRKVLEVGCGHGGGTAYIMRSLKPGQMEGIDRSERSIRLCRERYPLEGLVFRTGDALALPYGNEEFDAVLNIESSHAYPCMETFLREVHRVLRPGGHLLFADLRPAKRLFQLRRDMERSEMRILKEEDITANVLKARDEFTQQMEKRMKTGMKWFGHFALSWLGAKDSLIYRHLQSGRFRYLVCVLQRPGQSCSRHDHSMKGSRT